MMPIDDDLTPEERDALDRLPRETAPPPGLEQATVSALAARGLLRSRRRPIPPVLALAASVLLFAGGLALGRMGGPTPAQPEDPRPRFALFLYEGPEYDHAAPDEMDQRVQEYVSWAAAEHNGGAVEGGEKLKDGDDLAIEPDGSTEAAPPPPGSSRLAGYFLVRASDRRAALEIARSCPHVRYGGRIVIREIDPI